jgi:hypothetical protein
VVPRRAGFCTSNDLSDARSAVADAATVFGPTGWSDTDLDAAAAQLARSVRTPVEPDRAWSGTYVEFVAGADEVGLALTTAVLVLGEPSGPVRQCLQDWHLEPCECEATTYASSFVPVGSGAARRVHRHQDRSRQWTWVEYRYPLNGFRVEARVVPASATHGIWQTEFEALLAGVQVNRAGTGDGSTGGRAHPRSDLRP